MSEFSLKFLCDALELMGLDHKSFKKATGIETDPDKLTMQNLSVVEFMSLMDKLYLSEIDFRGEYSRDIHKRVLSYHILKGEYPYRVTKELKAAVKLRVREEDQNLCGRLKFQNKLNRALGTSIKLPASDEIFPFWLLKVVHKIKKNIALRKHILKHGDFKDFTYYDRRYDPEEQCYSGYYRDLYSYKTGETKLCLKEGKY